MVVPFSLRDGLLENSELVSSALNGAAVDMWDLSSDKGQCIPLDALLQVKHLYPMHAWGAHRAEATACVIRAAVMSRAG
jgi:hypothetical protein